MHEDKSDCSPPRPAPTGLTCATRGCHPDRHPDHRPNCHPDRQAAADITCPHIFTPFYSCMLTAADA
eukprot:364072-Chlamydomonas_euryale.AAC.22